MQSQISRRRFLELITKTAVVATVLPAFPAIAKPLTEPTLKQSKIRKALVDSERFKSIAGLPDGDGGAFFFTSKWRPTADISMFVKMPYEKISKYLSLGTKTELSILYPGAGVHIAPLELALRLMRMNPSISKSNYVYTEIADKAIELFSATFEDINSKDLAIVGRNINYVSFLDVLKRAIHELNDRLFKPNGWWEDNSPLIRSEVAFILNAFGKKIEVIYGMGMSEPSDHPYFKAEYAKSSDIILFHDSFSLHSDLLGALKYVLMSDLIVDKPKVIIFDDFVFEERKAGKPKYGYDVLPGEVIRIPGSWGCRFDGAIVYLPDVEALHTIRSDPAKRAEFQKQLDGLVVDKKALNLEGHHYDGYEFDEKHPFKYSDY
jgi:hypothetical protein